VPPSSGRYRLSLRLHGATTQKTVIFVKPLLHIIVLSCNLVMHMCDNSYCFHFFRHILDVAVRNSTVIALLIRGECCIFKEFSVLCVL
jgi:hypothetical protein